MLAKEFVDATVFMGMNSTDEAGRHICSSFFAQRLEGRIAMSLEQVGRCDQVIWGYPRELQDAYYPFMDNLHTDLRFDRIGYDDKDVRAAGAVTGPDALGTTDRLTLAMAANRGGVLYTLNPRLLAVPDAPVCRPDVPAVGRVTFPAELEALYQESLALLVDPLWLCAAA